MTWESLLDWMFEEDSNFYRARGNSYEWFLDTGKNSDIIH